METSISINSASNFWKNPEIVESYAKGNAAQQRRYLQAFPWLKTYPVTQTELQLDIGCGTAENTMLFAMGNPRGTVFGVDYSEAMIRVAQQKVNSVGLSNLQLWYSDATQLNLPTAPGTIDRMVSFTAIHWFPELEGFMQGVNRYLKDGGRFFFRYAGCEGDETLEIAKALSKQERWQARFSDYTCPMKTYRPEVMRDAIRAVGLVCEKTSLWENTETFASPETYRNYVEGWLPHLYHLKDPKERQEFLNTVVEIHCSRPDRQLPNGGIEVKDTQVEIWGYKPNQSVARL